jgi:pimeloyl-ACP methyl ester carboxylesterase
MGGFTSCGEDPVSDDNLSPRGANTWSRLKSAVRTLKDDWGVDIPWIASCHAFSYDTLYYIASGDKHPKEGDLSDFNRRLDKLAGDQKTRHNAVIVGHSWGGYDAFRLARKSKSLGRPHLITNDPINASVCDLSKPHVLGCRNGLNDLPNEALKDARSRVATWTNFYQDMTLYLHSKPVRIATSNHRLGVEHIKADTHPKVWSTFLNQASPE